ncbi:hypothetical protein H0H93_002000 [Arthromyces matolae]|nr:hypothetical protein H0H93_002000 [Arthromyces matolae]
MPWTKQEVLDAGWKLATDEEVYTFATNCWNDPLVGKSPRIMSLAPLGRTFLSLNDEQEILVRDSYKSLFERTWQYAHRRPDTGLIITGQPGSGKTFFLFYLLVQLLRRHQHVVFYIRGIAYLFSPQEDGYDIYKVYPNEHPELPPCELNAFVWSLIEVLPTQSVPPLLVSLQQSFPIMAPSPNGALYRDWKKQREARLWGMPLWNHDELLEGLRLCRAYPAFESKLGMVLEDLSNNRHPVFSDMALKAAFQVLSCHFEDKQNPDSDDASPSKSPQGNLEDSNAQASSNHGLSLTLSHEVPEFESSANRARVTMSLSKALGLLIADTVRQCGPDAREVFRAILMNPNDELDQQEAKISHLTLAELEKIVDEFESKHSFPDSWSSIISLQPVKCESLDGTDRWQVAFKSEFVAKCALRRMEDLSLSQMKESFLRFNSIPAATSLAWYCFEMFAHRVLRSAQHEFSFYEMAPSDDNPPNFTSSADTCSHSPSGTFLRGMERHLVWYNKTNLPARLEDSDPEAYFVPDPTNSNPFFDAFFYELAGGSATLYILQMTSASDSRGSKDDFISIRDIVYFLKTQQHRRRDNELPPQSKRQKLDRPVTVKYILVCPVGSDGPFCKDPSWQMPDGWGEVKSNLIIHGQCFLLPIRIEGLQV